MAQSEVLFAAAHFAPGFGLVACAPLLFVGFQRRGSRANTLIRNAWSSRPVDCTRSWSNGFLSFAQLPFCKIKDRVFGCDRMSFRSIHVGRKVKPFDFNFDYLIKPMGLDLVLLLSI